MRASLKEALEELGWEGTPISIENDSVGAALTGFARGVPPARPLPPFEPPRVTVARC